MIRYFLSNNQRKALVTRATPLRLLIPDDGLIPEEQLRGHAESVLDVPAEWIRSVRPVSVVVRPYWETRPDLGDVGSVIGQIVHGDVAPGDGAISVGAIEVILVAAKPRHDVSIWQWPGRFEKIPYDGTERTGGTD